MATTARVSAATLARVRWQGEATFRVLQYYFSARWNRRPLGEYVLRVLERFVVPLDLGEIRSPPTPGVPPRYSLVDLGRRVKNRYCLLHGDVKMMHGPHPSAALEHLFWHVNSEAFRTTGTFLLIHAGAVATPSGEGVLLPADSGAGKSTLVAALVRAGFSYLSDEAGAIDPVTRRLYPYPKALSFKRYRATVFDGLRPDPEARRLMKHQWHLRPDDIRPGAVGGPCEIRFIIAPRYEEGATTQHTLMTSGAAALELTRTALNLPLYGSRALPMLADVARGARSYRLISGDIEGAVGAIAELTGAIVPLPPRPAHDGR